jgi:hypothetical protein
VATLNYAGISLNPFEFDSGTAEQRKEVEMVSKIFEELVKQKFELKTIDRGSFEWGVKNIDKDMQR